MKLSQTNKLEPIHNFGVWASIVFLLIVFLTAYNEIILQTIGSWVQFERSYGLLIFCISLYMVWVRRKKIIETNIETSPLIGGSIVFVGATLLLVAKLSNTLMLQGVSLIITLLGLVLSVLGSKHFKLLLIPVSYLIFMFSLIEEFLGLFSKVLQNATAEIAAALLAMKGLPVFVQSELIQLPHITLEVAKVCNGVNHIVALVALAVPMTVISNMKFGKKVIFVIFAFIIGLFANGLRVALIGWWTIEHGQETIHGPFELFYVSFILIFGFGIIFLTRVFLGIREKTISNGSKTHSGQSPIAKIQVNIKKSPVLISALIIAASLCYFLIVDTNKEQLIFPLSSFPKQIGEYLGHDIVNTEWPFKNITGDQIFKRIYINPVKENKIGILIVYFENQTQGKEVLNQRLLWLHSRASVVSFTIGDNKVNVNRGTPRGLHDQSYTGDRRTFYFFYYLNGQILTNPYRVKMVSLLSTLLNRRSDAAMIVFSDESNIVNQPNGEKEMKQFITKTYPILKKHLKTII